VYFGLRGLDFGFGFVPCLALMSANLPAMLCNVFLFITIPYGLK